ncbi:ribosome biogenesis GTPase [Clostridium acidisoli DSM 12555]|uniref:Small ribosomal subunit biogenesis GTPase RsgA n=1 Tax=Clostridium acidisoli DSM 12555 TaxID=1121291 RepID=A0A1W1XMB4_9CLOT|nr:ribosome small subunit-dependent GTPase A [Clostridium acidisoli]SMC25140.1 ribosome biogenesis GTPase [Clostridium acidisoli DSM 12555]
MKLSKYGWNEKLEQAFKKYYELGMNPGRVFVENKNIYKVYTEIGEIEGKVSGKFQYETVGKDEFPAVGDWVAVDIREEEKSGTIHEVLKRSSCFFRKTAGAVTEAQVIASNFNYVFIVTSLNFNFNLRRIERYLTIALNSGGIPVIILSKADLCENVEEKIQEVRDIAFGVEVYAISSLNGEGINDLLNLLQSGLTAAVVGSSGVGKSTLLNKLAGKNLMETSEIREEDSKGKHTTTKRQLFLLPSGGIIIDTPGTRELGLWDTKESFSDVFNDIEELSTQCKFRDCKHENEPGCNVKAALESGILDEKRFESYRKLLRENIYIENKQKQINRKRRNK